MKPSSSLQDQLCCGWLVGMWFTLSATLTAVALFGAVTTTLHVTFWVLLLSQPGVELVDDPFPVFLGWGFVLLSFWTAFFVSGSYCRFTFMEDYRGRDMVLLFVAGLSCFSILCVALFPYVDDCVWSFCNFFGQHLYEWMLDYQFTLLLS